MLAILCLLRTWS